MSNDRFYLNCPYDEKDDCKSLGGWWDNDARKWYVPNDVDRNLFKKWWPKKTGSNTMSSRQPNMTSADEDNDGHEPTFQEAKDEFEYWLEFYVDYAEMDNTHFKWKFKKGREPDVLAYLILEESEQRKFRN